MLRCLHRANRLRTIFNKTPSLCLVNLPHSLPRKRVHPGVEDGTLESEIIEILDELKPSGFGLETDPRWDKLKKIKNK